MLPLCGDSRGGGRGGGGENSGGWSSSSFDSSLHESFRGGKAWEHLRFRKNHLGCFFATDRPAGTSRPWCTWHLRWQRGRRSEAGLRSGSGPYDNAASPAAPHRCALTTDLCGGTSTHSSRGQELQSFRSHGSNVQQSQEQTSKRQVSTRQKVPERPIPALQCTTTGPWSEFRQPDSRTLKRKLRKEAGDSGTPKSGQVV